jgi:integrase
VAVHAARPAGLPGGPAHPLRPVSGAYLAEHIGRLWPVTSSDALTGSGGHATATQTIEVAICAWRVGGSDLVQDHGARVATALAGAPGAAEADDDGALRGRAPSPDPAALGTRAPVPDHPLGRFELGARTGRRRTCSGNLRCAHRVLSLALTAAVRDGRLVRNVAEGVPLPRVVATPKRFLTHDQVQALAEACAPYGTLIRVLAYAGLRWGELVALTTRRIDLARRRIEVVEAITEVHGRVVVGTTKTCQRRSVPIPRFLADELADHLTGKAHGDLVFTAPEGGVLRNTNFRPRFFDPAAEKVGLLGLTPHELRHTAASLAIAAGANAKRCS